jgi:hypothetical protein
MKADATTSASTKLDGVAAMASLNRLIRQSLPPGTKESSKLAKVATAAATKAVQEFLKGLIPAADVPDVLVSHVVTVRNLHLSFT